MIFSCMSSLYIYGRRYKSTEQQSLIYVNGWGAGNADWIVAIEGVLGVEQAIHICQPYAISHQLCAERLLSTVFQACADPAQ